MTCVFAPLSMPVRTLLTWLTPIDWLHWEDDRLLKTLKFFRSSKNPATADFRALSCLAQKYTGKLLNITNFTRICTKIPLVPTKCMYKQWNTTQNWIYMFEISINCSDGLAVQGFNGFNISLMSGFPICTEPYPAWVFGGWDYSALEHRNVPAGALRSTAPFLHPAPQCSATRKPSTQENDTVICRLRLHYWFTLPVLQHTILAQQLCL